MSVNKDKIIKDDWKASRSASATVKALAENLNTIARMLNNFVIMSGGSLSKDRNGITLRCTCGGGGTFGGTYYFKGKYYTLTGTRSTYWYHNESTGSGSWSDGPMPDPMPAAQYWRRTDTCSAIEYIMC